MYAALQDNFIAILQDCLLEARISSGLVNENLKSGLSHLCYTPPHFAVVGNHSEISNFKYVLRHFIYLILTAWRCRYSPHAWGC